MMDDMMAMLGDDAMDPNPEFDGLLRNDMPSKKKSPLEALLMQADMGGMPMEGLQ